MREYLIYVPIIITLVTGLLGLVFSKTGKREKMRPIGYVFIALMLGSTTYAVYDLWAKGKSAAAAKQEAAEAKQRQAFLQSRVNELTRAIELEAFDRTAPFRYGIFYLDIGLGEKGEPIHYSGFTGPFPNLKREGTTGTLHFRIADVFDYSYHLMGDSNGVITLSRESSSAIKLSPDVDYCYQDLKGECLNQEEAPKPGQWWVDLIAPEYTHGVKLATNVSVAKLISEALQASTYGQMVFEIPNLTEQEYRSVLKNLRRPIAQFKFYVPLINRQGREECQSQISLPVKLIPSANSTRRHIEIDLVPGNPRFWTDEREESPF